MIHYKDDKCIRVWPYYDAPEQFDKFDRRKKMPEDFTQTGNTIHGPSCDCVDCNYQELVEDLEDEEFEYQWDEEPDVDYMQEQNDFAHDDDFDYDDSGS